MLFLIGTLTELVVAGAENCAEYASAWGRRPRAASFESESVTKRAGLLGKSKCFRSSPLHKVSFHPHFLGANSFFLRSDISLKCCRTERTGTTLAAPEITSIFREYFLPKWPEKFPVLTSQPSRYHVLTGEWSVVDKSCKTSQVMRK